ncbi:unnamed protein product [Arctia plantaginis]|uniref:Uncharacterized protein n=1 Tax=Arctia plantaginis TaxID=874455 RepID=A0A8S1AAY3_ARCPL|nr:unnamed protein product [Arctia plantaginis]
MSSDYKSKSPNIPHLSAIKLTKEQNGSIDFIEWGLPHSRLLMAKTLVGDKSGAPNVGSEDVPEITKAEIRTALDMMSNGKALDEDDVIIEMVKEGGEAVLNPLSYLFNKCLEEYRIPKK